VIRIATQEEGSAGSRSGQADPATRLIPIEGKKPATRPAFCCTVLLFISSFFISGAGAAAQHRCTTGVSFRCVSRFAPPVRALEQAELVPVGFHFRSFLGR
jgi:hypothetical protein